MSRTSAGASASISLAIALCRRRWSPDGSVAWPDPWTSGDSRYRLFPRASIHGPDSRSKHSPTREIGGSMEPMASASRRVKNPIEMLNRTGDLEPAVEVWRSSALWQPPARSQGQTSSVPERRSTVSRFAAIPLLRGRQRMHESKEDLLMRPPRMQHDPRLRGRHPSLRPSCGFPPR